MLSKTLRAILEASAENARAEGPSVGLLREVWPTLLDEPLSHRTRPLGYANGTLTVGVASEAWLKEARRNHRRLHARIHRLLPWPVDKLDFVVESLPPAPKSHGPAADPAATPAPQVVGALRDDLDKLDEPTRELLLRIRSHLDAEK